MSSIDRLLISGIRSFAPDHPQTIKFQKPLTILVGHNGSGKTTVVECLKYACSGDMPPGVKGGNFIQDPKISGESEVKAQVKLQFRDVSDAPAIITRSMQATQKAKKAEFKTLESVIKRKNKKTNENLAISSKCADIDAVMIESLGVSKAVINNVIFCHQEDSCWPLGEGKALKTKFDDIFDATKYNKALENIRKVKKQQDEDAKRYQTEMKYVQQQKETVAKMKEDMAKEETRLIAQEDTLMKLQREFDPIAQKIQEIDSRWDEFHEIDTKIEKLKTEQKGLQKNLQETKAQLQTELPGSIEDLESERRQFDRSVREKQIEMDNIRTNISKAQRQQKDLQAEGSKLQVEQGRLEERAKDQKVKMDQRRNIIFTKATELQLQGFNISSILGENDVIRFLSLATEKKKALVHEIEEVKSVYEDEEKAYMAQIDLKVSEKTKLETTVQLKSKSIDDCKQQIAKIDRKLKQIEAFSSHVEALNAELSKTESELVKVTSEMNVVLVRKKLEELKNDKNFIETKIRKLYEEKSAAQSHSSALKEIESLQADLSEKDISFRRIFAQHEPFMTTEFTSIPENNFRNKVDEFLESLTACVQSKTQDLQEKRISLSGKQQQRQTLEEQLVEKEKSVKDFQEELLQLSGSRDLNESLRNVEEQMTELRNEKGLMEGEKSLYGVFESKIKKNSCCPVCMRGFENKNAAEEVVTDLGKRVRSHPANLKSIDKKLEKLGDNQKRILMLQPKERLIEKLNVKDIPELRKKIEELKSEILTLKDSIDLEEDELNTLSISEGMGKQMQSDAGTMDNLKEEMKKIQQKLNNLKTKTPHTASECIDIKDIQNEIDLLLKKKDDLSREFDSLDTSLRDYEHNLMKLRDKVNQLTQQKLDAQKDDQERLAFVAKKESLVDDIQKFIAEVEESRDKIEPLEKEIISLRSQKADVIEEKDGKIAAILIELEKVKVTLSEVANINDELERFSRTAGERDLLCVSDELKKVKSQLKATEESIQMFNEQIRNIQQDLDSQQTRQRNILDNIRARELGEELRAIQRSLEEQQKKIGYVDSAKMAQERKNLIEAQQKLQAKLGEVKGTVGELKSVIKRYERDLSTEPLSSAVERYRDILINYKICETAGKDLQKYSKALEVSIMKFHNMKMAEINKTIRDLWTSVYRGSDIDYIEIKAEEDESGSEKRRNFNYRVVLHASGAELDMRGRCSAGQKILASLLIRIALAETFSANCGVLALDEPTTNLDRENVISLAETLLKLVKERSGQKNLQLIIITHDEEFVKLLLQEGLIDRFVKVSKNLQGQSELEEETNIGELRE